MNIGIYPRKLAFFCLIGLAVFGFIKLYPLRNNLLPEVSASLEDNVNMSDNNGSFELAMILNKDGSINIGDNRISEAISPMSDKDELRYVVLDQPNYSYDQATITLNLPKKLNRLVEDPQIIAVHGATPISADFQGQSIVYTATGISQSSTVTIVADFPKGYFDFSATKKATAALNNIPGLLWVVGGIALPFIAVVIILWMFFKSSFQLRQKTTKGYLELPPANLSPAVAGAIYEGRVSAKTIIATLVDLARRDYIELYNRGSDFVIYLNPLTPAKTSQLRPYELILLDKIFLPKQRQVGSMDVEARIARHLFSRKVSIFYLQVYQEAVSLGYFAASPAVLHLKYRLIGIGTFFAGLIGYLIFAIYAPDPKFVLFFWLSLVLFGVLIVNLAPRLTQFTLRGDATRDSWLKFRNFLCKAESIGVQGNLFELYLPYALAMGCEAQWSARFIEASFSQPSWYSFSNSVSGIEGFTESLNTVVDYIGQSLDKANEPLVR